MLRELEDNLVEDLDLDVETLRSTFRDKREDSILNIDY